MSYILEALQRSERERRQTEAPSIHAPAAPLAAPAKTLRPWVAATVLLLNLGVLIVWFYRERSLPAAPAPAAVDVSATSRPAAPPRTATPVAKSLPAGGGPVVEISELPTRVQQALPPLQISAHIHVTGKPASGFVVINGVKLREGESRDGLALEKIRRTELILRYQGHRFRLPVDFE